MQNSRFATYLSVGVIALFAVVFLYITYKALLQSSRTQVGTDAGIYTSYVSSSEEIAQKAFALTKGCGGDKLCNIQRILDYVTHIPYKSYTFQQKSPQQTIKENFGDCDDKSNLLVSLLHALGIESYFVLVPKHIFVVVPLEDSRLSRRKGLWIDGRKFYILESTAKGSQVGYPLKYRLDEIDVIVELFANKKLDFAEIKYKL